MATKGRKKTGTWSVAIATSIIAIIAVWAVYSFYLPSLTTTPPEPTDFTLPVVDQNGLTGKTVSLSSFRGKVVLLDLMEPWCSRCQNMSTVMDRLYREFEPKGVVFLSVGGPRRNATATDIAKFIRDYKPSWTYTYDSSGEIFATYNVTITPTYYIITKNFSVATTYQGITPYDALATWLNRVTSESWVG